MKEKLLLLHGALGSKKQFDAIKDALNEQFDVYDLNFEGHGGVQSDKEFSIQLFTENVIKFLEEKSIEKINIFGYSMGGYVALNTALKVPDSISKIVTLGTKFNWSIEAANKEVKMLNPDKIEEKVPQFANKLKEEHQPQDWKEVVSKTANMMLGLANGHKLKEEDLKKINHKVVIGIGSLDKMVSLEESENASKLLPNGSLNQLKDFKHPIDKVNPSDLVLYVKEALGH